MEKNPYERSQLIGSLMQIPHGDLNFFTDIGLRVAKSDPELLAHLVAWNSNNSKVKDGKIAYPILSLRGLTNLDRDLAENAVAHLLLLDPRDLNRAIRYNSVLSKNQCVINGGWRKLLQKGLQLYLDVREKDRRWFDRTALSSRKAMRNLYREAHKKPSDYANRTLFQKISKGRDYPENSIFNVVRQLKNMTPKEAASAIVKHKIPFQVIIGASASIKNPDLVFAIVNNMTGNELINSTKMLTRLGVFENPTLKGAYDQALERAKSDKKVNVYKASKAAVNLDEKTAKKVLTVQAEHEQKMKKIPGNWLVAGDKSGSMQLSIDIARKVASVVASQVEGEVYLLFFDLTVRAFSATGKNYEQIYQETRRLTAEGGTWIGGVAEYARKKELLIQGIVVISDGGEHERPTFAEAYKIYCQTMQMEPSVYLIHVPGEPNVMTPNCRSLGVQIEEYEVNSIDEYSLPNIVRALKPGKFGLLEEILETPFLTINQALKLDREAA